MTEKKTETRTTEKTNTANTAQTKRSAKPKNASETKRSRKAADTSRTKRSESRGRTGRPSLRRVSASSKIRKRQQEVRRLRIIIGSIAALALLLGILFLSGILRPARKGTLKGVNSDVMQYQSQVEARCKEFGISQYSTLLMALMQQESSGQGTDVFQCSESPFNTEYDNSPGSIADADYSIQVGVETFAYCLEQAECKRITDTDALKLAIQEYNFGNNYAGWARENYGGYSEESAFAFSEMMKAQLGWETYGDPEYVQHVLQYIDL